MSRRLSLTAALGAMALCPPALATTGSSNVAPIEPPVAHPASTPCVVTLFGGAKFGADPVGYEYAPPAACPGPWAKVVLATDISVEAGRQFDRTGTIWLDGVNLWFGTTAEPRATLAPSWHVERDVTDDTALFGKPGTGHVLIANYQSSVYTSTITAHAELRFYPATATSPAPRTPDVVIGFANDSNGDTVALDTGTDRLSRTLALPGNIERAVFDATLQGQSGDEFWYTCVPEALAGTLQTCGGGAFREGEITVDGRPAGVAPVFPVVFTGGIDPYLWEPVPDVSTLDLKPFRVDLTPFAGTLDQSGTHTISISVAGANEYFSATGTLYLYLDHGAAQLSGSVVSDTLAAAPAPTATNETAFKGGDQVTSVDTVSHRPFSISGVLQTSHGSVSTTVAGNSSFTNLQHFAIGAQDYTQDVAQDTETDEVVTTVSSSGSDTVDHHFSFPLALEISYPDLAAPTYGQSTRIASGYLASSFGTVSPPSLLIEAIASKDTLLITGSAITGHQEGSSEALYASASRAGCSTQVLASSGNVLTKDQDGSGCADAAAVAGRAAAMAGIRAR